MHTTRFCGVLRSRPSRGAPRRRRPGVTLIVAVLVTSSCGTRVQRSAIDTDGNDAAQATNMRQEAADPPAAPGPEDLAGDEARGRPPRVATTDAPPATTPPGTSLRRAAPNPSAAHTAKPDQGQIANLQAAGTADGVRTTEPNGAPAPKAIPGPGTQLVIGQVGTFGGPVGNLTKPLAVGVQAWVRMINDRGGIAGHRIGYVQYDDGADPARYRMALQDLVEHRGVIAFVSNTNALSGSDSAAAYLEEKRVPVLGGDLGTPVWANSWIHFPNGTTVQSLYHSALVTIARLSSNKRLGSVVCAESPACGNAAKYWAEHAAELGLQYVYGGRTSMAAPDFTAECLAARNAGAQVLAPFLDTSSIRRLDRACSRQGYHPQYLMLSSNVSQEFVGDPNMAGSLGSLSVFPPSVRGTPATDEYAEAIRRFVGEDQIPNGGIAQGWEAAKMFEKAAANVGEPPSRERLLEGLWAFEGETLGGLAPPLTFRREQPAGEVRCWFMLQLDASGWRAAQGLQPACP